MAFVDNLNDAEQAVRDAKAELDQARSAREPAEHQQTLATNLAGARIALAVLQAADHLANELGD